jgi:hypothetical protein
MAVVRGPSDCTSLALASLPHHLSSRLITIKADSTSPEDFATSISDLQINHSIHTFHVVIPSPALLSYHFSKIWKSPSCKNTSTSTPCPYSDISNVISN